MPRADDTRDSDISENESEDDASYVLDHNWDFLSRGSQALGLSKSYVPGWTPAHAIREFYQNWSVEPAA